MCSANNIKSVLNREGRNGFSLVVVILAILIMMALGFLALSVTTTDLKITDRIVGEKKALIAAEAGIHVLTSSFDPANIIAINGSVDATGDPASIYHITSPSLPSGAGAPTFLPLKGYSMGGGEAWGLKVYNASVTGENTTYQSSVQVDVGFGYFDGGGVMYR